MKKNLLKIFAISMAALASVGNASADEATWGYCNNRLFETEGSSSPIKSSIAIYVPAEVAKAYKGAKVVGVDCGIAYSLDNARTVTAFVYTDFYNETRLASGSATVKQAWNTIKFDNEYVITGEPFYVAVSCSYAYPYRNTYLTNDYGRYMGYSGAPEAKEGPALGLRMRLADDANTPMDLQLQRAFDVTVDNGKDATVLFDVRNQGCQTVNEFTVSYTLDHLDEVRSATFNEPIKPGEEKRCSLVIKDGFASSGKHMVNITVDKVNGVADAVTINNSATAVVTTDTRTYVRRMLVEELTAFWCPNCPRGIVGSRYMEANYPNEYVSVSVHFKDGSWDVAPYTAGLTQIIGEGMPKAAVNRNNKVEPSASSFESNYLAIAGNNALAAVSLDAVIDEDLDPDVINAVTTVALSKTRTKETYRVGYILVENGIEENQADSDHLLDDKVNSLTITHNDVARGIYAFSGYEKSLPTTMRAGEEYTVNIALDLKQSNKVTDRNKMALVAVIYDIATGDAVNVVKVPVRYGKVEEPGVDPEAGVESVAGSVVDFRYNGTAFVGDFSDLKVYTIGGSQVAPANLASGIYVVKASKNGVSTVKKVVVK